MTSLVIVTALVLDTLFGEPARFHPLVGFGKLANRVEQTFNHRQRMLNGTICMISLLTPPLIIAFYLFESIEGLKTATWALEAVVLYWAIGHNSLKQHVLRVQEALDSNQLEHARTHLSKIVSRNTSTLDQTQITQATVETTLENGNDAIFAPIFWFVALGPVAVIGYRLVNTLDAMWGYRNERFERFGKASAITDDVLNYIPARLVAISYALLGDANKGFKCWFRQAHFLNSPNAGPVMTAGAGSLNIKLGGPAYYHGQPVDKPFYGGDQQATTKDIDRSLDLIAMSLVIWTICIFLI